MSVETIPEALAGERLRDGQGPTGKEVVQVVEHRGNAGDRGREGWDGCEDGAQIFACGAPAERDEGGPALANPGGLFRRRLVGDTGSAQYQPGSGGADRFHRAATEVPEPLCRRAVAHVA